MHFKQKSFICCYVPSRWTTCARDPGSGNRSGPIYHQSQWAIWGICVLCACLSAGFSCTLLTFPGIPTLHPPRLCPCSQRPHGVQKRRLIPAGGTQGKGPAPPSQAVGIWSGQIGRRMPWGCSSGERLEEQVETISWDKLVAAGRNYWSRGHAVSHLGCCGLGPWQTSDWGHRVPYQKPTLGWANPNPNPNPGHWHTGRLWICGPRRCSSPPPLLA